MITLASLKCYNTTWARLKVEIDTIEELTGVPEDEAELA